MNTPVNFENAKLLKEKGFSWECENFYKKGKYDTKFYLTTGTNYDSDRNCVWDWNLNGGKSGKLTKVIPYPNDDSATYYSAPTVAEAVMWLYETHELWILVIPTVTGYFTYKVIDVQLSPEKPIERSPYKGVCGKDYSSPTEAYSAAIENVLKDCI